MAYNSIHFEWDKAELPEDMAAIEIVLNPPLKEQWTALLYDNFPIAMMQGETINNPDESTTFKFCLPMEDANRLKVAFLTAYTNYSGYLSSN